MIAGEPSDPSDAGRIRGRSLDEHARKSAARDGTWRGRAGRPDREGAAAAGGSAGADSRLSVATVWTVCGLAARRDRALRAAAAAAAFYWLLCFWLVGAVSSRRRRRAGAIKPNKAFMLRQSRMDGVRAEEGRARLTCFERTGRRAIRSSTRLIYSADTLLPIVSLGDAGILDSGRRHRAWRVGRAGYLWLHIAVGWALSLLAVAGFSGLVKSD